MDDPALYVGVAFHNMAHEAPRTLHSLSPDYQRRVSESDNEVVVVDAGSAVRSGP